MVKRCRGGFAGSACEGEEWLYDPAYGLGPFIGSDSEMQHEDAMMAGIGGLHPTDNRLAAAKPNNATLKELCYCLEGCLAAVCR